MTTYRTEVEARQLTSDYEEIVSWVNDNGGKAEYLPYVPTRRSELGLLIDAAFPACVAVTAAGAEEFVDAGDWVIKDALSKFHTCTAAAFAEMYEEVGK